MNSLLPSTVSSQQTYQALLSLGIGTTSQSLPFFTYEACAIIITTFCNLHRIKVIDV